MIRLKKTLLLFSLIFLISGIYAQEENYIGDKKLYYGAAYYPEGWDLKTLEEDIKYMKEANINVVRMAEFAWSQMEPREGEFHFEWLHKVIEKLHANGIDVVLGTPTATPPAWMSEKYPQIYQVNSKGVRKTHGARRNCSYTSKIYREKSRIIIEKMAREFGDKPGVIGWQTDNEFHLSFDYSEETEVMWHEWLKEAYGSIDALNRLWGTELWSQEYNSFSQVPMPRDYIWHHPSLRMAWIQFTNKQIDDFQDIHIEAIRKYSDLPITHDGMPGQETDYERLFDDLDFMAVNNYHSFEAYDRIQSNYDRMRGYDKGYHWLFETAPNYSGGGKKGQTWFLHQPEGSMHAAIWMNYALGGQGTMFWLWRQHWAGQEMTHGSFISSWGKPAANFQELKKMGAELRQTSDYLMNAPVEQAKAAIFWSHNNAAWFEIEEYANGIDYYNDWTYRFYRPIADAYIHRDVINPGQSLEPYKLLFAPMMPRIRDELRTRLEQWVKDGGILVLGPMSGYRNDEWTSFKDHAMGDIAEWSGIEVDSRIPIGTEIREAEIPVMLHFKDELNLNKAEGRLWSEALSSSRGEVLATYQQGMHDGEPAIIEATVGKGKVVVLGTDPRKEAYKKLSLKYAREAGIKPLAEGDGEVVIAPRKGENTEGYVIVNISNKQRHLEMKEMPGKDMLTGKKISDRKMTLEPYEVKVCKKQ
jgi:beta-galactosidase GanA